MYLILLIPALVIEVGIFNLSSVRTLRGGHGYRTYRQVFGE